MWTPTSRRQHSRVGLRYGSDLTGSEWAILEPLLPPPGPCGRKRKRPMRRIVEAIVQIVRKADNQIGFRVHKRRWVVERFFAWIGRNRRFSRDVERLIASVEAFLCAASSVILLRRMARC